MIAIGKPGMAHADAIRVIQSLIRQSQLLFGYDQQRHQSPICKAAPNDVRFRTTLWKQETLKTCESYFYSIFV